MNPLSKVYLPGQKITDLDVEFFQGDPDEVAKRIQELNYKYPSYSNIKIEWFHYQEEVRVELIGTRLETDQEFATRVELLKKKEDNRLKKLNRKKQALQKEIDKRTEVIKQFNLPADTDLEALRETLYKLGQDE